MRRFKYLDIMARYPSSPSGWDREFESGLLQLRVMSEPGARLRGLGLITGPLNLLTRATPREEGDHEAAAERS
jgi:hypothetical protein